MSDTPPSEALTLEGELSSTRVYDTPGYVYHHRRICPPTVNIHENPEVRVHCPYCPIVQHHRHHWQVLRPVGIWGHFRRKHTSYNLFSPVMMITWWRTLPPGHVPISTGSYVHSHIQCWTFQGLWLGSSWTTASRIGINTSVWRFWPI